MKHVMALMLLIVGAIHLLPLAGVLGPERLTMLYGFPVVGADLEILLRHRAVLFGLLGALLVASAWVVAWRGLALIAGWISVASFLGLAYAVGDYGNAIRSVVIADWIAAGCLAVATLIHFTERRR